MRLKPTRWYTRDEIKEWFRRRGISYSPKDIVMFTEELQKAFEKGWEKRDREACPVCEAAEKVVKNACSYGSGQLLNLVESELIGQLAERLEAVDD